MDVAVRYFSLAVAITNQHYLKNPPTQRRPFPSIHAATAEPIRHCSGLPGIKYLITVRTVIIATLYGKTARNHPTISP